MRRLLKSFCAILALHPRALEPGARQHIWHGGSLPPGYERGWPSYHSIPAGGKKVGVKRVELCVIKLAVNSSVCGVSECADLPLQRVTKAVKFASTENIFLRKS
jgi:hypothetical protein